MNAPLEDEDEGDYDDESDPGDLDDEALGERERDEGPSTAGAERERTEARGNEGGFGVRRLACTPAFSTPVPLTGVRSKARAFDFLASFPASFLAYGAFPSFLPSFLLPPSLPLPPSLTFPC